MKSEMIMKVNKIGNIGQIISNIAKIFVAIGIIACLVGGIVLTVLPDDFVVIRVEGKAEVEINMPQLVASVLPTENGTQSSSVSVLGSLELNGMEYGIVRTSSTEHGWLVEAESDCYNIQFQQLANLVWLAGLDCIVMWIVLHFCSKLCKLFKECETPFSEEIVQMLKKLVIAFLPMAVLSNLTTSVTNSMMSGNVKIVIGLDVTTVLLIVFVCLLTFIFSYGAELQQQSDETL